MVVTQVEATGYHPNPPSKRAGTEEPRVMSVRPARDVDDT